MRLFELIAARDPEVVPTETKIHLATWNGREDPLEEFLAGTFQEWQQGQIRRNFERQHVLALIKLPVPNRWLFAGLYDSSAAHERGDGYYYDLKERSACSELDGRLIVKFVREGKQAYRYAENCMKKMFVDKILDVSFESTGIAVERTNQSFVVPQGDDSAFAEGRARFKKHRILERDGAIVRRAKAKRRAETGHLRCEVCDFDFVSTYGSIGEGFIEAHHTTPVSQLSGKVKTKICDLALVCSNCHRMLHRGSGLVADLKRILRVQKQTSLTAH